MAEQTIELRISGVDCAECTAGQEKALAALPGVRSATVLPGAEKAIISAEGSPDMAAVQKVLKADARSTARSCRQPVARLEALRALGVRHVELLTGDNERVAASIAGQLGVAYRANLLPEDKIAVVAHRTQHVGRLPAWTGAGHGLQVDHEVGLVEVLARWPPGAGTLAFSSISAFRKRSRFSPSP